MLRPRLSSQIFYLNFTSQVAIEECEDVYKEIPFLVDDEECEDIPRLECQEVSPTWSLVCLVSAKATPAFLAILMEPKNVIKAFVWLAEISYCGGGQLGWGEC